VALAKTLNLKVVAEGVETEAQQAFLTELGCNTLQGYLLGKPVSAQTIEALCARGKCYLALSSKHPHLATRE
jgi:EAL domain-containing protein (putative c-di-GMP-specific phosphodiesterase class I)